MAGVVSGWGAEPAFRSYARRKVEQHSLPANPPAPPALAGCDVTRAARAGVALAGSQRPRQNTRVSGDDLSPRMVFRSRPSCHGHVDSATSWQPTERVAVTQPSSVATALEGGLSVTGWTRSAARPHPDATKELDVHRYALCSAAGTGSPAVTRRAGLPDPFGRKRTTWQT